MGISAIFDAGTWGHVPFHFWTFVFFVLGAIVGSFLNVCIYRMPLGQSIVSPPSHCPHCNYSIPWYLNIPLVTWLFLRGKCANCGAPISIRYWLVELLTGIVFMLCWLEFGHQSAGVALVYSILMALLIVATFIDFEHFIIPDEITMGGIVAGLLASLLTPGLHGSTSPGQSLLASFEGVLAGAVVVYAILRLGKLLFGMRRVRLEPAAKVYFTETAIVLPGEEIAYEELLYRASDTIKLEASTVELSDRCYRNVRVQLSANKLLIGEEQLDPNTVPHLEATTDELQLPREAMGLGDVKFMAMIGAFLGWQAIFFSLMLSSVIGSGVGVLLIIGRKHAWSSRLPYGPYIALAAAIWVFGGHQWWIHFWNVGGARFSLTSGLFTLQFRALWMGS